MRYRAIRQSLGEPDAFRLQRRQEIKELVGRVIRQRMSPPEAIEATAQRADDFSADERARFIEVVNEELDGLHEGNLARYQVRPSEFRAWKAQWN
jgi:hypothetical protein